MKKLAAAILMVALTGLAHARDDRLKFPIAEALQNPYGAAKINSQIKMVWGSTPKGAKTMGTFTSNKKTNFFNKSDKEGCEIAFQSAVISLQERAVKEGGTAVVNIVSVYKNAEFSSSTEYECGAGKVVGGVALRGTVVK